MSLVSIRTALLRQLSSISPTLPTAWENSKFEPVSGSAWQRVDILPAPPENTSIGTVNVVYESGIFQVLCKYPLNNGPNDATRRAELIKTSFPRGLSLTCDGVTLHIEKTPEIAPALPPSDGWYTIPVSIPYYAHIRS